MKTFYFLLFAVMLMFNGNINAQTRIYPVTTWEYIFNASDFEAEMNGNMESVNTNMRFTAFFNWGQNWHFDFNNKMGIYTGFAFRNVGIIVDDSKYNDKPEADYSKVTRRSYNLGIPLSFKYGNFNNHMYFYGGAEIELMFHYKEKYWIDGVKYKSKEWFSDKTERWAPSVFVGVQLPGGFNIKYKYYFNDFLNHSYKDSFTDFSSIGKSSMWYISVGWQFHTMKADKIMTKEFYETAQY